MGEILVGTCSWTDRALVPSGWYPPGLRDTEGRLRHYAAQLFQFPPWFAPEDAQAKAYVDACARRTAGWPVAVEFRHPGWWQENERAETAAELKERGVSAVAVDMTQKLPASIPPILAAGVADVRQRAPHTRW